MAKPITIVPDAADKAAIREAKLAMRLLAQKLDSADAKTLIDFVGQNIDAFIKHFGKNKNFTASFDNIIAASNGTPEQQTKSKKWLQDAIQKFLKHSRITYSELKVPSTIKKSITTTLENKKATATHLRAALKATGYIAISPLLPAHYIILGLANAYRALTAAAGLKQWQSTAALAALLTGLTATQLAAKPAEAYADLFLDAAGTQVEKREACKHFNVAALDSVSAAFVLAMAPKEGSKNYAAEQLHFISAMRAIKQGVSPVALYILSSVETGNFRSIKGPGTAEGPYQALKFKNIEMAVQHYQESPAYKEAKERLAERDRYSTRDSDLSMTTALEGLAKAYKTDKKRVIAAFTSGRVSYEFDTAFKLAHSPVISGDLMATEVKKHSPELTIEALKGHSIDTLIARIGNYYTTHLPGPAGGAYLKFLAEKFPNIRMDSPDVAAHYNPREFAGFDANFTSVGTHYPKMARANTGVFKSGTSGTAAQYIADIKRYVAIYGDPVKENMELFLSGGTQGYLVCYKDPLAVLSAIPATTNGFEIAGLIAQQAYQSNVPSGTRETISYTFDVGQSWANWAFVQATQRIRNAPPTATGGDAIQQLLTRDGPKPKKP